MYSDAALETNPQWAVAPWDPGIGPTKPNAATCTPATVNDPFLSCYLDAPPGYANALYATHRAPTPFAFWDPACVPYSFDFMVLFDAAGPQLQCLEFEALWYYGGYVYRNQMQLSMQDPHAKNMLQAYTPSVPWANTGIVVPPPVPGNPWPVTVSYVADTVAHTCSIPSVFVGGKLCPLPGQFQAIPAQPSGWKPGMYVQFQLGGPSKGVKTTVKFSGINVNWL